MIFVAVNIPSYTAFAICFWPLTASPQAYIPGTLVSNFSFTTIPDLSVKIPHFFAKTLLSGESFAIKRASIKSSVLSSKIIFSKLVSPTNSFILLL